MFNIRYGIKFMAEHVVFMRFTLYSAMPSIETMTICLALQYCRKRHTPGKGEKKTLDNDDTTNDSKNNSNSNNNV